MMPTGTAVPALPDFALSAHLMANSLRRASEDGTRHGGDRPLMELDLSSTPFLTAACLGRLVSLRARLAAMGGRLVLLGVRDAAWEAIRATGLDARFDVRRA